MTYIEQQMETVCPFPIDSDKNGIIRLKMQSERGSTNWLNLTPEAFREIEQVLIRMESTK